MSDIWNKVPSLLGQELATLRGNVFTVQSVTETTITVLPHSTGKPRPIRRQEIEKAARLALDPHSLTAKAVRDAGASEVNPVYVLAILKALFRPMPLSDRASLDDAFRRMELWHHSTEIEMRAEAQEEGSTF